jgi:hypothetical protein
MTEIQADMGRFKRDVAYYEAKREELLQQYPEQWVAIYNQEVVGAARDLRRLLTQIVKKGVPRGRAFVEYVTDKEELLIL